MLIVLDVFADIPCILCVDFVAVAFASAFVYVFTGLLLLLASLSLRAALLLLINIKTHCNVAKMTCVCNVSHCCFV